MAAVAQSMSSQFHTSFGNLSNMEDADEEAENHYQNSRPSFTITRSLSTDPKRHEVGLAKCHTPTVVDFGPNFELILRACAASNAGSSESSFEELSVDSDIPKMDTVNEKSMTDSANKTDDSFVMVEMSDVENQGTLSTANAESIEVIDSSDDECFGLVNIFRMTQDSETSTAVETSMKTAERETQDAKDFRLVDVCESHVVHIVSKSFEVKGNFNLENQVLLTPSKAKCEMNADKNTEAKTKNTKKKTQGLKKKWKHAPLDTCSFEVSLLPWQTHESTITADMDIELQKFEAICDSEAKSVDAEPTASTYQGTDVDPTASTSRGTDVDPTPSTSKVTVTDTTEPKPVKEITPSVPVTLKTPQDDPWYMDWRFDNSWRCQIIEEKLSRKDIIFIENHLGAVTAEEKRLRRKKKWMETKARIQVKTKHCWSVRNAAHGTPIYINHRVSKRMCLSICQYRYPWNQPSIRAIDKRFDATHKDVNIRTLHKENTPIIAGPVAQTRKSAKPNHTLTAYNADGELTPDLVNILITLQDRDLTPEDYELLLRLDERVAPKTVDNKTIEKFKVDEVTEVVEGDACAVCMTEYELGMKRKHLPCGHYFHEECLVQWLKNSTTCPLDGLDVTS